jgi:hypothetical protein
MSDFKVYSVGICYASVCTSLQDVEEITRRLNEEIPTGVSPWRPSKRRAFNDELSNPRPCDYYPETHRHILFEC